jgi:hypothetical protein
MKKLFNNRESRISFTGFEFLTSDELLKVRGGGDTRPETKPRDIFELDEP